MTPIQGKLRADELNKFRVCICLSRDWKVEMDLAGIYYVSELVNQLWEVRRVTRSAALMLDTWNSRGAIDDTPVAG